MVCGRIEKRFGTLFFKGRSGSSIYILPYWFNIFERQTREPNEYPCVAPRPA
jgi:hypothetical protein